MFSADIQRQDMSIHSRALLGAIDQALMAAAHFLLGVMVARYGGIAALGGFAFAYTLVVLANMLHGAILGEIYSVDDAARSGERKAGFGFLLVPTLAMAILMIVLSQSLRFWGSYGDVVSSMPFMLALGSSMCLWSGKIYFYCNASAGKSVSVTLVYAASMLFTTFADYHYSGTMASPFSGMALGASLCLLFLLPELRIQGSSRGELNAFGKAAWRYAKWSVPAAALIWFANNGYYLLVPAGSDLRQTAGLRAVLNLLAPINTLLVGASAALLPLLADTFRVGGRHDLLVFTHRLALVVLGGTALFALIMVPMSAKVLSFVYGPGFGEFALALQLASVLPVLWGVAVVYRTSIRAMGESFGLFKVYFFALCPVGVTLMVVLSRAGASRAVIGVAITQLIVVLGFVHRFAAMTRSSHEVQLRQG